MEAIKYQPIRSMMGLQSATTYGSADHPSSSLRLYKTNPGLPAQLTFDLAGLLCQDVPG